MRSVANHAISCPSYGALIHESPSTSSNSKRTFLQRTGLLALKRSPAAAARHRSRTAAVKAGRTLLESSASIDVESIVAEAPRLLALSSDFDWQQSVSELREEALGGLSAQGERALALDHLSTFIDGWLHDSLLKSALQPDLLLQNGQDPQEELGVRIKVEELRWHAALQATEELANGVDSSFDWESEAAELRQCLVQHERVELEQKLWSSWESARVGMDKDAEALHDEALKTLHSLSFKELENLLEGIVQCPTKKEFHTSLDSSCLSLFPGDIREEEPMEGEKSEAMALEISGLWWTLVVLATTSESLFGNSQTMNAASAAADETVKAAVTAVTRETPGWVAPSVLAFPVVSYILFTLYRNKVNPYAKLTDWVFGLVAMAILGNLVLIATVGVRLY